MNNSSNTILKRNRNGEFLYLKLNSHLKEKYKPDSFFNRPVVAFLIVCSCAAIDLFTFISLFKILSFDSMLMLCVQTTALVFGFDVVPVFMGIHYKKLKQNLSNDRLMFYLALSVCGIALALNIVFNIMTINILSAETAAAGTDFFNTTATTETTTTVDPTVIALTIFRIAAPFLTSLGSFYVGFMTSHPLQNKKQIIEKLIGEKEDELRRLNAIQEEYNTFPDVAKRLGDNDAKQYEAMVDRYRADVLYYCEYVKQKIKEHLQDPTANNVLSQEEAHVILERLDRELAAFIKSNSRPQNTDVIAHDRITTTNEFAA